MMVGKETQCAEYKATEPKYRKRWEVKTGLCAECRGVHGMDGPGAEERDGVEEDNLVRGIVVEENMKGKKAVVAHRRGISTSTAGNGTAGVVKGKQEAEERGRARSRAITDPTAAGAAVPVPVPVSGSVDDGGGNVVKGTSGKVVTKRVVRKRIATL